MEISIIRVMTSLNMKKEIILAAIAILMGRHLKKQ